MSVRSDKRGETKLAVLENAKKLSEYTLRKCTNNNIFPLRFRNSITTRLNNASMDAMICIFKANKVLVKTEEDFTMRRNFQNEAHANIQTMLVLIDLAYKMFEGLTGKKVDYWITLCYETDEKLMAWMRSDAKRYEKLLAENKEKEK